MDTTKLKRVAPFARRTLQKQVEAKLAIVLAEDSLARRESLKAVQALQGAILVEGKEHLIERVAYTWFNRFCALRFMDLQGYNQVKVLSPADPSKFQPEILADAKNGIIDNEIVSLEPRRARIFGLLDGTIKSHAAQDEAYSLLLVSACNYWSKSMPFLFQHISDYTELLLPDGLLAGDSVPTMIREAMIPLTCESVEVLGWLYQFYVSEKKEQVFTDLKKNKKITPENIPAATQLFTPDWIVRYLVENSLGRLWLLNRPTSMLAESMEYYIKPEEVARGQWIVDSEKKENNEYKKLQGFDCLAEEHGTCATYISGDQNVSQRGTLRINESSTPSCGLNPIEHSGRTSTKLNSGVQTLSIHSKRVSSRSGDAAFNSETAGLYKFGTSNTHNDSSSRSQQDATSFDGKTEHALGRGGEEVARREEVASGQWPVASEERNTNNSPLSSLATSHYPLATNPQLATSHYPLATSSPEDIKICDPACGSGHMLTYAFDLLYAMYEEEGYSASEIPTKILTHNLYGVELDERAGALASFALTMKAREKNRRFFRRPVKPNICVLKNVTFKAGELNAYRDEIGHEHFSTSIIATLHDFEEADNFGSLIRPTCTNVDALQKLIDTLDAHPSAYTLQFRSTYLNVVKALQQAIYLAPRYHALIANPPYMGGKGMNARLGAWAKTNYKDSKSDLFAMFMERGFELLLRHGYSAMVTMQSWMFLSSYETLRGKILKQSSIETMAHMANMVMGIAFGTSATVFKLAGDSSMKGAYCYVEYENLGKDNRPKTFPPSNERNKTSKELDGFFRASASDFAKIPGSPVAYWVSERVFDIFACHSSLDDVVNARVGLQTGDNNTFLRHWYEVNLLKIGFKIASQGEADTTTFKWFPYNKGGDWRKWFGNCEYVVNWENNGRQIRTFTDDKGKLRSRPQNTEFYFKPCTTWTFVSSSNFAVRASDAGFIFDVAGSSAFPKITKDIPIITAFLASSLAFFYLKAMNPTLNFQVGNISSLPWPEKAISKDADHIDAIAKNLISLARSDWDAYETSWDFTSLPLLRPEFRKENLAETYTTLRKHWQSMTNKMQELEEENNRIFIDAYGLQDELSPDVPLKEITLTCNPHYRYGGEKTAEELDALLLADTMRELVSYAVGCMFGRYSLDKEGLVLANAGEGIAEYTAQVPSARFLADEDNVIPILDGNWFSDDIVERFQNFLKVTFGSDNYRENLNFVENSLNVKGKRDYSIRDYFLNEFYNDHVKRYKKRPVYWLFTSPRGTFNALMYMHRYSQDTASIVLNNYLRDFISKLENRINQLNQSSTNVDLSNRDRAVIDKELQKVRKDLAELKKYESEVLYPLATQQVTIDLDDGVKVNYPKLGNALKKIVGLGDKDAKEE